MNVVLICQTGSRIGLGHFSRTLALAQAFKKISTVQFTLFIQGNKLNKAELDWMPHQFFESDTEWMQAIIESHQHKKIDFIVFDMSPAHHMETFFTQLSIIQKMNIKIIGIDGFDYDVFCEWIHAPTFYVNQKKINQAHCPVYYGWDCYLLPTHDVDRIHSVAEKNNSVLILTGGSDVANLNLRWPERIDAQLPEDIIIDWVQGPYAKEPYFPGKKRLKWQIHQSPNSLLLLMKNARVALTVYGVSFFELISNGVPTIVYTPYGDRDRDELIKIAEENIATVCHDEIEAVEKLNKLIHDDSAQQYYAMQSKNKFTQNGAELLAQRMMSVEKS